MRREPSPLFPLPELSSAQIAVLRYLAYRRRAVSTIELSGELGIAPSAVKAALIRLVAVEFAVLHETRSGRWGRVSHSATPAGRTHARAVARAIARIAPLTQHGLTRRQAEVLHVLLAADGPLTIPQITAHYVLTSNETARDNLRSLADTGLCTVVETRTEHGHVAPAYLATDAARALTSHQQIGHRPMTLRRGPRGDTGDGAIHVDPATDSDVEHQDDADGKATDDSEQ